MIWAAIHILWSAVGTIWLVVRSGNPASVWGWIAFMLISPPVATLLRILTADGAEPTAAAGAAPYRTRLQNCILANCGAHLAMRNRVEALHNADRTFAAIMRDLQRARREIDIEYYIISDDRIGRAIAGILMRRARAGVRVRIIYDALGSWRLGRRMLRDMHREGIETAPYGRLRFPYLTPSVHRRNHRKIVIIDGRTAYLGGINIAGRYVDGGKMGFWRDEHIRIEGDAVAQAQSIFAADWMRTARRTTARAADFVPCERHGVTDTLPVQIAWAQHGPSRMTLTQAFVEAIASARRSIRISTPYFLPPQTLFDAIRSAAKSGVRVELLVPMRTDVPVAGRATDSYVRECVEAGITVYRYRNGFLHSKTLLIDDCIAAVGSANMDYRSLEYNLEAVAFIYDRAVTADYISKFHADVSVSEPVTARWIAARPFLTRLAEGLARLVAPVL